MHSFNKKFAKMAFVSLATAALVACGEDETSQMSTEAKSGPFAKPEPAMVMKDPFFVKYDKVTEADRAHYTVVDDGLNIVRFYIKNRGWDEKPEEVADSLVLPGAYIQDGKPKIYERFAGLDENLQVAYAFYKDEKDTFAKHDYAVKFNDMIKAEAEKVGDSRLVKFEVSAKSLGIEGYNFDTKSFEIKSCMLSDKTDYAKGDKSLVGTGRMKCLKTYAYNSLAESYQFGLTDVQWLTKLTVEDETTARAIEKMRLTGKVVFYGYIAEVKHARHHNDYGDMFYDKERQIEIVPQFVDFVDGDNVIYTAHKS